MAKFLDVEKGLSLLGSWSRWHILMYALVSVTYFYASMHMLVIVFVGMVPATYHCKVPDGVTPSDAIPPDADNSDILDHCSHYQNFSSDSNITVPGCPLGWEYSDEIYSIVHEWDTVCDDAYKISTSQTILVVGVMVGAMVMATLADYVGRKRVLLGSVLGISALGFCVGWVKHYWLFCALRFLIGVVQQGIILAGFIYACEFFPMADRTIAGALMQLAWGIGMFWLDFFAYFVREWDNLMFAISVPGLLVIPMFWILPESIPYLVAKGRLREAKEILQAAAKMNGVKLPPEFDLSPDDEKMLNAGVSDIPEPPVVPGRRRSSVVNAVHAARRSSVGVAVRRMSRAPLPPDGEVHNYTCIDILKSRKLVLFCIIMAFLWCTSALVYYGLALNTGSLAGDQYLNFFLSALVELPAAFIAAALLQMVGRRWPLAAFHMIAGVPLFACIFIPKTTSGGTNLKPLIVTLSMIGKFGITACFASVFMFAPELFPTTIRGAGIGVASVGARVGNLIAPFTPLVVALLYWLPNAVFGVMCIAAALLVLLLPETLGRPLPQTIREVEQWTRTLSPEEKEKFKLAKKADKARQKDMKLAALKEEDESWDDA